MKLFNIEILLNFFILSIKILFIYFYLFMAVLGLRCCALSFSSCDKWGLLSGCDAWASCCRGFSCCGAWALVCALQYL